MKSNPGLVKFVKGVHCVRFEVGIIDKIQCSADDANETGVVIVQCDELPRVAVQTNIRRLIPVVRL